MKKTKKKTRDITTFNKRVIDFLTSPLILVSLLIALCFFAGNVACLPDEIVLTIVIGNILFVRWKAASTSPANTFKNNADESPVAFA